SAPPSVIVAREAVELKGDLREGPLVGTGPFIGEEIDQNGTSIARRNPDFFIQGRPYINEYHFVRVPDFEALKASLRSGNLEVLLPAYVTLPEAEDLKRAKPDIILELSKGFGGTEVGLRVDKPPFNDVRVRQAIYKAIDPKVIIDTIYGSGWLSVGLPLP